MIGKETSNTEEVTIPLASSAEAAQVVHRGIGDERGVSWLRPERGGRLCLQPLLGAQWIGPLARRNLCSVREQAVYPHGRILSVGATCSIEALLRVQSSLGSVVLPSWLNWRIDSPRAADSP